MTQFEWEALASDVGDTPSNMSYDEPFHALSEVVDEDADGPHLRVTQSSQNTYVLDINGIDGATVPDVEDAEIWMLVKSSLSNANPAAAFRVQGSIADRNGYMLGHYRGGPETYVQKVVSNTRTRLTSHTIDSNPEMVEIRARVEGNQLMAKSWPAFTSEPDGWHIEITDSDLTGTGGVGYYEKWTGDGNYRRIYGIGIGTGGDPAPKTIAVGTSVTPPGTSAALAAPAPETTSRVTATAAPQPATADTTPAVPAAHSAVTSTTTPSPSTSGAGADVPTTASIQNPTVTPAASTGRVGADSPLVVTRKPVSVAAPAPQVGEVGHTAVITSIGPGSISGTLYDRDRNPVEGESVAAVLDGERDAVAETDSDGSFELSVSDELAEYHIVALVDDRYFSYPYTAAEPEN